MNWASAEGQKALTAPDEISMMHTFESDVGQYQFTRALLNKALFYRVPNPNIWT